MSALESLAREWALTLEGPARSGPRSSVPVRTEQGEPGLLELVSDGAPTEHLALRAWAGAGAVRLLRADPRRGALLTSRTDPDRDLRRLPVREACERVAALYAVLHRSSLPQSPRVPDLVGGWRADLAALGQAGLVPRRFLDQARQWAVELTAEAGSGDVLLHGDLHFATVREAEGRWLAVAPRPVSGEPAYEVGPVLWHRWSEAAASGDLRAALVDRLYTVVDVAGLDEDRTRAWVCVRTMTALAGSVATGSVGADEVTRAVTVVKAVQPGSA